MNENEARERAGTALTNRKDEDSWEVGDRTPLEFNESNVDAEDDRLDVLRANGTCS